MKIRTLGTLGIWMVISTLISLSGVIAVTALAAEMTPEVAAKVENHRKQKAQQVTHEKKKVAADALKAERLKVYKAKQQVKQSQRGGNGHVNDNSKP